MSQEIHENKPGSEGQPQQEQAAQPEPVITCEVRENGSLLVVGMLEVKMPDGTIITKGPRTSFCRCGASANKPFCDGSHRNIGFIG